MPSADLFGELRSVLQAGAGTSRGWGRLCELVEGFEPERFSAQVLPYVLAHRDRFPEHLRFIPRRWLKDEALWPLARIADALLVDSDNAQAASAYLRAQEDGHLRLLIIHALLSDKADAPVMSRVVGQELPDYRALQQVRTLFILPGDWIDHDALYALLSSPQLEGLEWLVCRGWGKEPWLKGALRSKPSLRNVDLSVSDLTFLDELPGQLEALCMEYASGSLKPLMGWLSRSSAELRALNLNATPLSSQLIEPLARHPSLRRLESLTIKGDQWASVLAHPALLPSLSQTLVALTIFASDSDAERAPRWNERAWAELAELKALRALTLNHHLTRDELVRLLELLPELERLALIADWSPELVRALESRACGARLRTLKVGVPTQAAAAGVIAMTPERWPALRELYVDNRTSASKPMKLDEASIVGQLTSLGLDSFTLASGSLEALHQRCGTTLRGLSLSGCALSDEQLQVFFARDWPSLKLLKLNGVTATAKLWSSLVDAKGLPQLRWLQLNGTSGELSLDDVLASELDALEYVQDSKFVAVSVDRPRLAPHHARSEWLLTNRMMYWFYRDQPQLLGLDYWAL